MQNFTTAERERSALLVSNSTWVAQQLMKAIYLYFCGLLRLENPEAQSDITHQTCIKDIEANHFAQSDFDICGSHIAGKRNLDCDSSNEFMFMFDEGYSGQEDAY